MPKRQWPELWPAWDDLTAMLDHEGIDPRERPGRSDAEAGVARALAMLAETPVSKMQLNIIHELLFQSIRATREQYE